MSWLGPLFELVDDILDGDGYFLTQAPPAPAASPTERPTARAKLLEIPPDTSVLDALAVGLAARRPNVGSARA